ncbi:MAG: hypothetical protein RBS16_03995 [Candidatus Cloacimonadales bacterium]|jgi:hypothetical protein|nr:hypothetical protein [Candidatus Cloacimonadota bacterium]MDD2649850.1 hypothetical protein [Candidatus Cloacimonadota bacterium]MDD3500881.1 hypothetical protein [Candidatus Cloacimonadota bacterium]MDX9977175.1 hypothetical protein [Candidatus Cloacimonadales bacterium]
MSNTNVDLQINYDSLLKQGFAVIDVRYKEYDVTNELFKLIIVKVESDRDDFYPSMIKHYVGKEIKDRNIYDLWTNILKHKIIMSKQLNRDVYIKVAAMDYLENSDN